MSDKKSVNIIFTEGELFELHLAMRAYRPHPEHGAPFLLEGDALNAWNKIMEEVKSMEETTNE